MFQPICALRNATLVFALLAILTLPGHSLATDCNLDVSLVAGDKASLEMPSDTAELIVEIRSLDASTLTHAEQEEFDPDPLGPLHNCVTLAFGSCV